jgi:hypothetical protein
MKSLFALHNRLMRSCFEAYALQIAMITTISARLPMIAATATGFGTKQARRETRVMVTEKLRAASEGAQAGALETAKVTLKVLTGDAHPVAVAGHMMDVADATMRPANRKVLANAKRLAAY